MSKGLMKENHQLKSKVIPLLLIVLLLPSFITYSVAGSSLFAPSWLKNGLYATYASDSGSIYFYNETSSLGFDSGEDRISATFSWTLIPLLTSLPRKRSLGSFSGHSRPAHLAISRVKPSKLG